MKKVFFLVLLFVCLQGFSQSHVPVVNVWYARPDTVFAGDSIEIDFHLAVPDLVPYYDTTEFHLQYTPTTVTLWRGDYHFFNGLQRIYDAGSAPDSLYRIKLKIPDTADTGRVYIASGGNTGVYIYVKHHVATVIKQNHTAADIVESRYYNLTGAQIPGPVAGEIFIKIDIFEDGSYNSKRIFAVQN